MEGREKLHMDKYKAITNDWNYNTSYMLPSLPASGLENSKSFILLAQCTMDLNGSQSGLITSFRTET
jgi:hypothetical protein